MRGRGGTRGASGAPFGELGRVAVAVGDRAPGLDDRPRVDDGGGAKDARGASASALDHGAEELLAGLGGDGCSVSLGEGGGVAAVEGGHVVVAVARLVVAAALRAIDEVEHVPHARPVGRSEGVREAVLQRVEGATQVPPVALERDGAAAREGERDGLRVGRGEVDVGGRADRGGELLDDERSAREEGRAIAVGAVVGGRAEAVLALVFGRGVHLGELLKVIGRIAAEVVVARAEEEREAPRVLRVGGEFEGEVVRDAEAVVRREVRGVRACGPPDAGEGGARDALVAAVGERRFEGEGEGARGHEGEGEGEAVETSHGAARLRETGAAVSARGRYARCTGEGDASARSSTLRRCTKELR